MGKRQPKLTAAIILALIAATAGAVFWTYKSAYTTTMREHYQPSPTDLVNANSVSRRLPEQLLDRDREGAVLDLKRRGFTRNDSGPHVYIRRIALQEADYLIDERFELQVDEPTDIIVGIIYIRTTDAPIKTPYLEVVVP